MIPFNIRGMGFHIRGRDFISMLSMYVRMEVGKVSAYCNPFPEGPGTYAQNPLYNSHYPQLKYLILGTWTLNVCHSYWCSDHYGYYYCHCYWLAIRNLSTASGRILPCSHHGEVAPRCSLRTGMFSRLGAEESGDPSALLVGGSAGYDKALLCLGGFEVGGLEV